MPILHPFLYDVANLTGDALDPYVAAVCNSLTSNFLSMPRGDGFIEYPLFDDAYETLKRNTNAFEILDAEALTGLVLQKPLILAVLRTIAGFSPPELAHLATIEGESAGIEVDQGWARNFDKKARLAAMAGKPLSAGGTRAETLQRINLSVKTACKYIMAGGRSNAATIHRLDKVDTAGGLATVRTCAQTNVAYSMLLYERMLGGPFITHRNSVSGLVGDVMESAVEQQLIHYGITHHKTGHAEQILGFEQAPDFIVTNPANPRVVIEAKITEDDGTARDKMTRIWRLGDICRRGGMENIACIDGRGFKIRANDMRQIITATKGRVFTLATHRVPSSLFRTSQLRQPASKRNGSEVSDARTNIDHG